MKVYSERQVNWMSIQLCLTCEDIEMKFVNNFFFNMGMEDFLVLKTSNIFLFWIKTNNATVQIKKKTEIRTVAKIFFFAPQTKRTFLENICNKSSFTT